MIVSLLGVRSWDESSEEVVRDLAVLVLYKLQGLLSELVTHPSDDRGPAIVK